MWKSVFIACLVGTLLLFGCSDDDPPRVAPVPQEPLEIVYDTGEMTEAQTVDEDQVTINDFAVTLTDIDEDKNIETFTASWDVIFENFQFLGYRVILYLLEKPTTDPLRDWDDGYYIGSGTQLFDVVTLNEHFVADFDIRHYYADGVIYYTIPGTGAPEIRRLELPDHGENLYLLCVGLIEIPDAVTNTTTPYHAYQIKALRLRN